jgi:hypothetical protein
MPNQHEVAQLFVLDHPEDVGDVQREIDPGTHKVRAFAEAGQRRSEHGVSARSQPIGDALPGPAAVPRPVDEKKGL